MPLRRVGQFFSGSEKDLTADLDFLKSYVPVNTTCGMRYEV